MRNLQLLKSKCSEMFPFCSYQKVSKHILKYSQKFLSQLNSEIGWVWKYGKWCDFNSLIPNKFGRGQGGRKVFIKSLFACYILLRSYQIHILSALHWSFLKLLLASNDFVMMKTYLFYVYSHKKTNGGRGRKDMNDEVNKFMSFKRNAIWIQILEK